MNFFGAEVPQYRRSASVKGGFGVLPPTRSTKGANRPEDENWVTGRILLMHQQMNLLLAERLKKC